MIWHKRRTNVDIPPLCSTAVTANARAEDRCSRQFNLFAYGTIPRTAQRLPTWARGRRATGAISGRTAASSRAWTSPQDPDIAPIGPWPPRSGCQ